MGEGGVEGSIFKPLDRILLLRGGKGEVGRERGREAKDGIMLK